MAENRERSIEQLNNEADIAADFLEGLLDVADYDGDIEMGVQNNRPVVQIVSDDDSDLANLVGDEGQVVDALQQLTRLAVQQKTGERSHVIVDVNGYLKRKRLAVRSKALEALDTVRSTGEDVALPPMNSFERKTVHDIVREQGYASRSEGEEPNRFVTISAQTSNHVNQEDGVSTANPLHAVSVQVPENQSAPEQST